jgi:hypothetical protein
VKRLLLASFAALSVCLLAAAPAFTIVPVVVVDPPVSGGDAVDHETTVQIATVLATQIAQGGAINVVPPTPGIDRSRYLADARAHGADFYVTGFVTPIGTMLSVISQVVSTQSGTIVFSTSSTIANYRDVADQGDQLRAGILDRSSRGIQAFQATPAPAPATPAPSPSPARP